MERWELIICYMDHTWTTAFVDVVPEHIDGPDDVIQSFTEDYQKNMKSDTKDLAYVSVYCTENIEDEPIGWQPHPNEFPVAGLMSSEVYENLEHGKDCHPDVVGWIEVFESTIENPIMIPYDGKNKK